MRLSVSVAALGGCLFACLVFAALLAATSISPDSCQCNEESAENRHKKYSAYSEHRLAIIVPFRDRFDELLVFAPHIHEFLNKQRIEHHIFIVNQVDRYRFNRASLINIGFLYTERDYDYIAMHDVDLLPLNPMLSYAYPKESPHHVASPELHPKYDYSTFVGGILLVNRNNFRVVDGMSNKYWGWGLEDDEFYVRLKEAKLVITRPTNMTTDRTNSFMHIHDRAHRKRDTVKCYNQYEATRRRDRETGLHNVDYEMASVHEMTIDSVPVTVLNVKLNCDKNFTPWCDCPQQTISKVIKKGPKGKS